MGAQEALLEFGAGLRGNVLDGQTGGVGGYDAVRFHDLFDLGKKLLLDFQVFDDDLDHPVHVGQPVEVVLEIADLDHGSVFLAVETRRLGFCDAGQSVGGKAVPPGRALFREALLLVGLRQFKGDDIQQTAWNPRVGQMGGDGGAHDACP